MDKLGSLIYGQFCEDECDLCVVALTNEIFVDARESYPFWFGGEGKGNILSEYHDFLAKKVRSELAKKVTKQRVWRFDCGFCGEQFGLCKVHVQEILDEF